MSAGKGDTPRAVNGDVFRRNYDRIWRKPYPDDWTDLQIEPDADLVKAAAAHQLSEDIKDLREMLQSAQKENQEQARLLAMSADREEKLRDCVKSLVEAITAAIKAGDWRVDGACDPDMELKRAMYLLQ